MGNFWIAVRANYCTKTILFKLRQTKLTICITHRNFKLTRNAKTSLACVTLEFALDYINSKWLTIASIISIYFWKEVNYYEQKYAQLRRLKTFKVEMSHVFTFPVGYFLLKIIDFRSYVGTTMSLYSWSACHSCNFFPRVC